MKYYDYDRINSYNANFHMILTNRGYGKTYGAKKRAIKNFLKKGEQFVYVRRYKTELKKIYKFFDDIKGEFPEVEFAVKGNSFYINKKLCGYAIPLSTSLIEKSNPYPMVTTMIFDEFIIDKGYMRYLDNEVEVLLELISTVVRMRDNWRIYLLANNVSEVNPYFRYFDIKLRQGERFTLFQDGVGIVERSTDDVFMDAMKETKFGKLIKNTKYSDYAIENKSLRDSDTFVQRLPLKYCSPLYNISFGGERVQIWSCKDEGVYYCNSKIVEGTETVSLDSDNHDDRSILLGKSIRLNYIADLVAQFQVGQVRFETQAVKQTMYAAFKKLGIR